MASVNTCYTSASCNRCPNSADWGRNGLICYGYSRAIAIYQPEGSSIPGGVTCTFTGHTDRVNCVTWVSDGLNDETHCVSGSSDCTVKLWLADKEKSSNDPVCTMKGHEGSVTCVSAMMIPQDKKFPLANRETLIVTASIDSTVRIWSRCEEEVTEQQTLSFGYGFALSLATFIIPGSNVPVLACGCDDHKIHLYVRDDNKKFFEVIVLPGHEDWVRSLHFASDDNGNVLLASSAQDHMIRVWRFVSKSSASQAINTKPVAELKPNENITAKETIFSFKASGEDFHFAVSLDSVLCGHDNWVYSIKWQPPQTNEDGSKHQPMRLLSASMDKTMILWAPDTESGVWVEQVRVGDVGGNTLGFYGGLFSPSGYSILAHGYQGAFNQWSYNKATNLWEPAVTGGGHFGSVVDLSWSGGGGDFILSASVDQTTRLHAPWVRNNFKPTWFEIARPQVHGYDLQCLAVLGKYSFASGADEKLVRQFKAPKNFISNFCQICGHSLDKEMERQECLSLPEGANVPALGLSNKAVFSSDTKDQDVDKEETSRPGQYPENYFNSVDLTAPPTEDQLLQNTLWPEEAKLYGHGYEIFALAANPNGTLLASACKAAKADVANILLWDMETKKIVSSLSGCTLTVTQMAFSHQGKHLLAVSRDRTWTLYKQCDDDQFVVVSKVDKRTTAHARIIWSCAWSHDDKFFMTASRDKKLMIWSLDSLVKADENSSPKPVKSLTLPDSVTAVSAAPVFVHNDRYLVAAGLDNGQILLYTLTSPGIGTETDGLTLVASLSQREAHHLTVTHLAFRPCVGRLGYTDDGTNWVQLASSGADHAVRVHDVDLSKL